MKYGKDKKVIETKTDHDWILFTRDEAQTIRQVFGKLTNNYCSDKEIDLNKSADLYTSLGILLLEGEDK